MISTPAVGFRAAEVSGAGGAEGPQPGHPAAYLTQKSMKNCKKFNHRVYRVVFSVEYFTFHVSLFPVACCLSPFAWFHSAFHQPLEPLLFTVTMNDCDRRLIFIAVSCISFLATYTASAINVALPAIGLELGLGHTGLQYILTAYLMLNAAMLVPFGRLADVYGRRAVILSGMAIFLAAHIISACATAGWVLIVCRAALPCHQDTIIPFQRTLWSQR
jgi:hypothetical protein